MAGVIRANRSTIDAFLRAHGRARKHRAKAARGFDDAETVATTSRGAKR
jgi:hypothetical protein